MPRLREGTEDKENCEVHKTPTKTKRMHKYDATLLEGAGDVLQITNTSFSTLEEMCEKTASDPDSTLFRYLHHETHSESQVTRSVRPPTEDEEADALQRLLDELNVEETEKRLAQNSPNDTMLDDIEAPSRFWENTLTTEALQSISPVKMVGLLRQSTIMEECSDASETETSTTSYQSASKTGWNSETTGCYETANETVSGSENGASKKQSINSSGASSASSDLFQQRHSRQKFFSDSKEETHEKSLHLIDLDATAVMPPSPEAKPAEAEEDSTSSPNEDTTESLNFPDSLNPPESSDSPDKSNSSSRDVSNSSGDASNAPQPTETSSVSSAESVNPPEDSLELEPLISSSMESTQNTQTDVSSSVIDVSDDDSLGCNRILEKIESLEANNVLNRSFTIKSENTEDDEEKSLHFNDTMEEVEYMMKKGMQYMQAGKVESPSVKSTLTPVKNADRYRSPSPMLSSPRTPSTVIAKPKPVNKPAMDIKPFPKLDLFKKPQTSRLRAPAIENKFVSGVKKAPYAHVYSPIRAYINKTATTPLISTIKPSSAEPSKAFKQLEVDSRVLPSGVPAQASVNSPQKHPPCTLPKKAYISSELKHIVDERTPMSIPGGPKIHRYLMNSMLPAVVRHEGKVKLPAEMRTSDMGPPPAPRASNDSLADLSLASGDVSLYTIKDAQKF